MSAPTLEDIARAELQGFKRGLEAHRASYEECMSELVERHLDEIEGLKRDRNLLEDELLRLRREVEGES